MRVFSKASNSPLDLGILVSSSVASNQQALPSRYRNEFYLNEDGQVVWDMYHLSRSIVKPVASIAYDVVKE